MTNRTKATIGLLAYLTCVGYFFGVLFSGNHNSLVMGSALLILAGAQIIAIYLLWLVRSTEP